MADLIVTISGQPAAYRAGTLSISGSLGTRTTASLQTVDHPPFTSVVEVGQVVEIRDETGSLIFAGTVDSVEEEIDASKRLRVKRLACVDYTPDRRPPPRRLRLPARRGASDSLRRRRHQGYRDSVLHLRRRHGGGRYFAR